MKLLRILSLLLLTGICTLGARVLVNRIVAIIYHEAGTLQILASDMRTSLEGRPQGLKEVVLERLMEADAIYHRIVVTDAEADTFIENIQRTHKLSRKAVEDLFTQMGYTYTEAREFLRRRQMIERVMEFRVKTDKRMLIDRPEVEAYYKSLPSSELTEYTLAIAFVTKEQLAGKSIEEYLKLVDLKTITFDEPFTLLESEIADDKKSIIGKPAGTIVFVEPIDDGYEITQLVGVNLTPLDECYTQLLNKMRQDRFATVLSEYHKMLLDQATILFNDPKDREFVYGVSHA